MNGVVGLQWGRGQEGNFDSDGLIPREVPTFPNDGRLEFFSLPLVSLDL
jgi:hypothetical protein